MERLSHQAALYLAQLMEAPEELSAMAEAAKTQSLALGCRDGVRRLADLLEESLILHKAAPLAQKGVKESSAKRVSFFFARESLS